jgi:hypothetical protein
MRRSIVRLAIAVVAVFALSAGPALAFECYNASRSAQGNASVGAHSGALLSLEEVLSNPDIVGLCPAGVDHVIDGLDELGYQTDIAINFHTVMAGGLEKNGKGETLLHDGQGIDHLSDQFFEDAGALIEEGFAICAD